jgi:imidazolonepropionase-like amidohydrolase
MKRLALSISTLVLAANFAHADSFWCSKLLDVRTGKVLEGVQINVENERISGTAVQAPSANAMRLEGLCVPGFIDLHVHLANEPSSQGYTEPYRLNPSDIAFRAESNGMKTLRAGFTAVRDLGDGQGVVVSLRNAINNGVVQGPRIFAAGKSIATTGGHADPSNGTSMKYMGDPGPVAGVINSPAQARKAVRQRYKEGSDVIKITATGGVLSVAKSGMNAQFTDAELRAVVATAKDYGFTVAAHAHGEAGMLRAVRAGVTSIEHGTFMSEDIMKLMKQNGTWYVPTLSAGAWVAEKSKVPGFYLPIVAAKAAAIGPQIQKTLSKAYEYGVPIAFGTDAGVFPHGLNAREFEYLNQAGVPVSVAVRMATLDAAKVLRSDEIGEIAAGRYADFLLLDENALSNAQLLSAPKKVFKGGKEVTGPLGPSVF